MKNFFLLLNLVLFTNTVFAQEIVQFPFDQKMDLAIVKDVISVQPNQLANKLKDYGVDLVVVQTKDPKKPLNPNYINLPKASLNLIKSANFQESYEGRMISKNNECCNLKKDTLLIRDTALDYTLVHEFMHSLLKVNLRGVSETDAETTFPLRFRRFSFYQKKLFDDSYQLLNPLWRRDILDAQKDVQSLLFARIQISQSQEAIIEKTLSQLIKPGHPFYNKERQKEGLLYGKAMINNAIDMYNSLNDSIVFANETVKNLVEAVNSGDIPKKDSYNFSDKDSIDFKNETSKTLEKMQETHNEILRIKTFYGDQI